MSKNLLEVKNLEKYFEVSGGLFSRNKSTVKAVDGISFDIPFGSNKLNALAVVVLPHPLWPTKPKLDPKGISNEIPSTAFTVDLFLENKPPETSKYFSRFLTSNKFLLIFILFPHYKHPHND